jgi:hypothetical protein
VNVKECVEKSAEMSRGEQRYFKIREERRAERIF